MAMSYRFYEYEQKDYQGLDYVYCKDDKLLIMLPHGSEDGRIFDRSKTEISEETLLKWAELIRAAFARRYELNASDLKIAVAPCYPNAVRQKLNSVEVLGDWDTPTWAAPDAIEMSFIIKSHETTVRPDV
jgi:hypothetical protein